MDRARFGDGNDRVDPLVGLCRPDRRCLPTPASHRRPNSPPALIEAGGADDSKLAQVPQDAPHAAHLRGGRRRRVLPATLKHPTGDLDRVEMSPIPDDRVTAIRQLSLGDPMIGSTSSLRHPLSAPC